MVRRAGRPRPRPTAERRLEPNHDRCWSCGGPLWVAYHNRRRLTLLDEVVQFTLVVRRCRTSSCARYRRAYRPEEEGALALPHGEFGLDVIALVGQLRYREHRSVPEIHQELGRRGVVLGERTVGHLIERYEELVSLHLTDDRRLRGRLAREGGVVLALDGLQPDVGHEVLWVIRDCVSGEALLARSLLSATEADLVPLLREVKDALPVPILGVVSDGQTSIRNAVASALPGIPHQLCHFHYLREAARPIYEADRHAKKELKKHIREVRPLERQLETRTDPAAQATRAYCLAVRSALTDDGRPPLCAAGLRLYDRLEAIDASLQRVLGQGGSPPSCSGCTRCSRGGSRPRPPCGRRFGPPTRGCTRRPTCSRIPPGWTCWSCGALTAGCSPRWGASARRPARWRRRSRTSGP